MNERILTYVNIALVAACLLFLAVIATSEYSKPAKIVAMAGKLEDLNRLSVVRTADNPATETQPVSLNPLAFQPFYTPTPTPTPPPPTPIPDPPLAELVYSWRVMELVDENTVKFVDNRIVDPATGVGTEFTLKAGQTHGASDKNGITHQVKFERFDMENTAAIVSFKNQAPVSVAMFGL